MDPSVAPRSSSSSLLTEKNGLLRPTLNLTGFRKKCARGTIGNEKTKDSKIAIKSVQQQQQQQQRPTATTDNKKTHARKRPRKDIPADVDWKRMVPIPSFQQDPELKRLEYEFLGEDGPYPSKQMDIIQQHQKVPIPSFCISPHNLLDTGPKDDGIKMEDDYDDDDDDDLQFLFSAPMFSNKKRKLATSIHDEQVMASVHPKEEDDSRPPKRSMTQQSKSPVSRRNASRSSIPKTYTNTDDSFVNACVDGMSLERTSEKAIKSDGKETNRMDHSMGGTDSLLNSRQIDRLYETTTESNSDERQLEENRSRGLGDHFSKALLPGYHQEAELSQKPIGKDNTATDEPKVRMESNPGKPIPTLNDNPSEATISKAVRNKPALEARRTKDKNQRLMDEIERLFMESDKERMTVKSFCKSLEERLGVKLSDKCRKKVKHRLTDLVDRLLANNQSSQQGNLAERDGVSKTTTTEQLEIAPSIVDLTAQGDVNLNQIEGSGGVTTKETKTERSTSRVSCMSFESPVDMTSKKVETNSSGGTSGEGNFSPTKISLQDSPGVDDDANDSQGREFVEILRESSNQIRHEVATENVKRQDVCHKDEVKRERFDAAPEEIGRANATARKSDAGKSSATCRNNEGLICEKAISSNPSEAKTSKRDDSTKKLQNEDCDSDLCEVVCLPKPLETSSTIPSKRTRVRARKTQVRAKADSKAAPNAEKLAKMACASSAPTRASRKRPRKGQCALCTTCPCQNSSENDGATMLDLKTLSRSDVAVERALIRRIQKLEKSSENFEEQAGIAKRKLKKHRREMWRKREAARKKIKRNSTSRFLPDAEEFENEQMQVQRLHEEKVRKAQLLVFAKIQSEFDREKICFLQSLRQPRLLLSHTVSCI